MRRVGVFVEHPGRNGLCLWGVGSGIGAEGKSGCAREGRAHHHEGAENVGAHHGAVSCEVGPEVVADQRRDGLVP